MAFAQYQAIDLTEESEAAPFAWAVQIEAGALTLSGNVPYASVATILAERAGGEDDAEAMTLAGGAPLGFLRDAMKAIDAGQMLADGSIAFTDGQWTVSGRLAEEESLAGLSGILGDRTGTGADWIVEVETAQIAASAGDDGVQSDDPLPRDLVDSVEEALEENDAPNGETTENPEPGEPESAVAPSPEGGGGPLVDPGPNAAVEEQAAAAEVSEGADQSMPEATSPAPQAETLADSDAPMADADVAAPAIGEGADAVAREEAAQCRDAVAALTQDDAILFASGSTNPTAASEGLISDIADILAICPSQPVYVEGHTDADGRAETNLVLSLGRAEAVVDRLVEQGIDPQRLFAVGYGASLPVASNQTAAGKAENRRIVFSFEDIAQ
ncbi:OmpA family protein [Pelagibacterium halotolerans]|nr:OmpA family protein [Pelagibacterium halotolerans]QJR18999.1 OmpA family protein [Pelagibacterium halotolerans]